MATLADYDLRRDRITLELDIPPDLPRVKTSPSQLQQVLLNLLNNAQDALRQVKGERAITVRGRRDADYVTLEVRDTGPGIPDELLTRIFEPFTTTKPEGTGLGPAISAGIVQELGGTLTAGNDPKGGAVFRVTLPAGVSRAAR